MAMFLNHACPKQGVLLDYRAVGRAEPTLLYPCRLRRLGHRLRTLGRAGHRLQNASRLQTLGRAGHGLRNPRKGGAYITDP